MKMILQIILSICLLLSWGAQAMDHTPEELLRIGDQALASDQLGTAISYYQKGIEALTEEESLITAVSLYTNLGTALSSGGGSAEEAIESYRNALLRYSDEIDDIVDKEVQKDVNSIAAQTSFFLGIEYHERGETQRAADAYSFSNTLDPYHWASLANLGSILHDHLKQHGDALLAYNKAFEILTQTEVEPTDPPAEPRYILSQLQYRMGLAIANDPGRKCALVDDPTTEVSCTEMAANAFSTALKYDPDNEAAKHMLASLTADATMDRASSSFVQELFDNYASNFEHSLVDELGYNGYERLRRGFDRAFGSEEKVPIFSVVVDAGCGTGLTGEQFRNVSRSLIGVDLSAAIISEAQKARPELYDELRQGDITEILQELKPVSLIIAGDSFIYFGDLHPLFESMEYSLAEDGLVAFTLENVDAESEQILSTEKPDWKWQLTPSGRFAHRKEYVLSVGKAHGLELFHYETLDDFRHEKGMGVRGHMMVMQKKSQTEPEL